MLESLLALVFVFALLAGALFLVRRWGETRGQGRHLEVVETVTIGPGKTLSIVRVGTQCFLLAAGGDGVSLISELNPAELSPADECEGAPALRLGGNFFSKLMTRPAGNVSDQS